MKVIDVVAGVIFNDSGDQVLLALRKPEQHQGNRWEFPGGKLEPGETLQAGLVRELVEEIAITATRCTERVVIEHSYPDKQVRLHFWDVLAFEGTPQGMEGQRLEWVPLRGLADLEFPEANQVIVDQLLAEV
ncbi:8-oxo-dGTP diphosphatase MutT [Granulosicoccus sp. 3-233]|uniref:8-oxo-dGTP diphosphatase MutT n=1 Tax=Granulosicoccus sp. 3-233 TaxID=3417969 RepID=UPI003D333091